MLTHCKKYIPEYLSFTLAIVTLVFSDFTSFCSPDETMLVEGPASFLNLGFWNPSYFRCPYSPLFLILQLGWMPVFGMSHMSISALNVLVAFILSVVLLRQARVRGWMTSLVTACSCVLLYWGCPGYAWLITAGRPDVLAPLFTVLILIEFFPPSQADKSSCWKLFLWSFCAMMTSVTPIPLLVVLGALLFLVEKDRRAVVFKQGMVFVAGVCLGLLVSCLFWAYFKDLVHFLYRFFSFGAAKVHEPFLGKIRDAYSWDFITDLLSIVVVVLALIDGTVRKSIRWCLVGLSCAVPFILSLAGRYAGNYLGLHFIPVLACLFYVFSKQNRRITNWLLFLFSLLVVIYRPATHHNIWRQQYKATKNAEQAIASYSDHLKAGTDVINADDFGVNEDFFYPLMQRGVRLWKLPRDFWAGEHDLSAVEKFDRGLLRILKDPAKVEIVKKQISMIQSFPPDLPPKDGVMFTFDRERGKRVAAKLTTLGYEMNYIGTNREMNLYVFRKKERVL